MEHDTRTPAPQATARAAVEWPEPTPTELPAGTVAAVQPAHGTPVESCAATPHTAVDAAPPEAAEPPDLDQLGDQIAKLSATHRRRHLRAAVPPAPFRPPPRLGGLPLLRPLAQLAYRPRSRRRPREAARGRRAGRPEPHRCGAGVRATLLLEGACADPDCHARYRSTATGGGLEFHRGAGGAAGAGVAAGGPRGTGPMPNRCAWRAAA